MKSNILLILSLITCLGTKAQNPILVSEDSLNFGQSMMPALTVIIPESNYERTLKAWTRELQSNTKSKLATDNDGMSIFGVLIKEISPNSLNVYSKMMNLDSMVKLSVAFEIKKDQYIESITGEPSFTNAKSYIKEFAKNQYIEVAKDQLDAEDKKLRDLQRELSSLEKENANLQASIRSNNNIIVDEKGNIIVQNGELTRLSAEIDKQKIKLDSLEAGPVKVEKEAEIKDLEKSKEKVLNSISSSENRINRANNAIDDANREIPNNQKMQQDVMVRIEQQQIVYQKFVNKLKTIEAY